MFVSEIKDSFVLALESILEIDRYGQLSPQTIEKIESCIKNFKEDKI